MNMDKPELVELGSRSHESYAQLAQFLTETAENCGQILIVCDGLEKIQDDGQRSGHVGHILDTRLRRFLLDVADGQLGRVVVLATSRYDFYDAFVERSSLFGAIEVRALSNEAAVALLRERKYRR